MLQHRATHLDMGQMVKEGWVKCYEYLCLHIFLQPKAGPMSHFKVTLLVNHVWRGKLITYPFFLGFSTS